MKHADTEMKTNADKIPTLWLQSDSYCNYNKDWLIELSRDEFRKINAIHTAVKISACTVYTIQVLTRLSLTVGDGIVRRAMSFVILKRYNSSWVLTCYFLSCLFTSFLQSIRFEPHSLEWNKEAENQRRAVTGWHGRAQYTVMVVYRIPKARRSTA